MVLKSMLQIQCTLASPVADSADPELKLTLLLKHIEIITYKKPLASSKYSYHYYAGFLGKRNAQSKLFRGRYAYV